MTLLSPRRSFCFALISMFVVDVASAQYLDVPLIPQYNTLTCWAASMEMTMEYHGMPIAGDAQCELAKLYDYYNKKRNNPSPTKLTDPCPTCNQSSILNQSIDYSSREGTVTHQYMDMLYSHYGFVSQEDANTETMTWDAIQREIDACSPFNIFINYIRQDFPIVYNHVVVAKGYYENADRQFVLINNPQSVAPCVGCEGLMPISIFTDPVSELYSALSVVRSIQPQSRRCNETCDCSDAITNSTLMAAIDADLNGTIPSTFTEIPANTIHRNTYTSLLASTTGAIPRFIPSYIQYYPLFLSPETVQLLVSNINNNRLAYHFIAAGADSLKLKYVSEVGCTGFTDTLRFDGIADAIFREKHTVTSDDEGGIGIVKFLPGNEHFYRVLYEEEYYLSPINEYNHLPFKVGYLYEEDKVLNTFKCGERKRKKQQRRFLKQRSSNK